MNSDQIPASVVASFMTAPFVSVSPTEHINLTEPDTRAVLAHYWPAIERHVASQLADRLEQRNPDRSADFSEGVDWAVDELRAIGADDTVPLDSPEGVALLGDYFAQEIADHYAAKYGDTPA